MAIRVSGLISGLDTDSIVQELVSAYSTKKEKYEKAQTKLEWKMDAWKTMNSKIYGFYTSSLSGMRMSSAYSLKTSSVSNSSVAKVTASSTAVNGTQSLKVKQLAASGYMTGGVVKQEDGSKVKGDTALSSLGIDAGSKIAVNDKEIEITSDMTVNKLIAKLKDAGVSANFDETNQRFFINSTKSGAEGEFTITANNADGLGALQSLGLFAVNTTEKDADGNAVETSEMAKYREIVAGGDDGSERYQTALAVVNAVDGKTSYSDSVLAAFKQTIEEYEKNSATVAKYEANQKIIADYEAQQAVLQKYVDNDDLDKYRELLVKEKKTVTNDDGTQETVDVRYSDAELEDMKKYIEEHKDSSDADEQKKASEYQAILDAKAAIDEFDVAVAYTNDADNRAKLAEARKYVDDSTNESEYQTSKVYMENASNTTAYQQAKMAVSATSAASFTSDAARITGQDSIIELNGATFTSSTGTFSINGLSITAMQVTGDQAVSITTATDTQGIYDKIKSFLGKYNELIKEMDTAYNAASAGDYEPLTDDEKEEMTDSQIEKWETKIKDALLRRDSTLGNASSSMKSIMNSSFEINGKTYSLDTFGIGTLGYFSADVNERGCLHIDGDADDSNTSGNTDKLMAAINEDPEAVAEFFQKLSSKLYDDLTKRMSSSSVSSIYTIYNDKQMSSEYSDYKDKIDKWQEKLEYYEEYYYKQFSAMETALSKLQSSTSSLSNLLGS